MNISTYWKEKEWLNEEEFRKILRYTKRESFTTNKAEKETSLLYINETGDQIKNLSQSMIS